MEKFTTTDGNVKELLTIPVPEGCTFIDAIVIANRKSGLAGNAGDSAKFTLSGVYKNIGGTVTELVAPDIVAITEQVGWSASLIISGTTVLIQVKGAADNTVEWFVKCNYESI